jgi:hypothetical protein
VVESRTGAASWTWSCPRTSCSSSFGKMEVGLFKSSKSDTLCFTVSHLVFGRRKNRNRERTVKSVTSKESRDGGTGRRSGLKIRRPSGLGGSTPPPGTKRIDVTNITCLKCPAIHPTVRRPEASVGANHIETFISIDRFEAKGQYFRRQSIGMAPKCQAGCA